MNRTVKFQLSNIKKSLLCAVIISYVGIALTLAISYFFGQTILTSISDQPIWVTILFLIVAPLLLFSLIYTVWDGTLFFDTSIRLGVSRRTYFISQLITYSILSIFVSAATGISEVDWAGSTSNYFAIIGKEYLSLAYIVYEFLGTLLLASFTLAIYRFKSKIFIPIAVLFALFVLTISSLGSIESPFIFEMIINTIDFITVYKAFFTAAILAGLIGVYYFFISTTEVQD